MVDHHTKAVAQLSTLSELASEIALERASERTPETIERVLEAAKEELGMEVAFVSEFTQRRMVFRKLAGDAESFGWKEDDSVPVDDTFCQLLLEGRLPNVIPDAKADGRVKFLNVTGKAGIGSYVGAPIRFSDGHLYGTFCVLSHSPEPSLVERDGQFVRVLARLVAEQIERERHLLQEAATRARIYEQWVISRELHDRVAHTMVLVSQSLQLYEVYQERDPERAAEKLELAKRMAGEALKETKDLSQALRESESEEGIWSWRRPLEVLRILCRRRWRVSSTCWATTARSPMRCASSYFWCCARPCATRSPTLGRAS